MTAIFKGFPKGLASEFHYRLSRSPLRVHLCGYPACLSRSGRIDPQRPWPDDRRGRGRRPSQFVIFGFYLGGLAEFYSFVSPLLYILPDRGYDCCRSPCPQRASNCGSRRSFAMFVDSQLSSVSAASCAGQHISRIPVGNSQDVQ